MDDIRYYYTGSGGVELILTSGRACVYPWHMHARHWTVGVLGRGSALLTTLKAPHLLRAGQHFVVCPQEPHSLRVEGDSSLAVVCIESRGGLGAFLGLAASLSWGKDHADVAAALSLAQEYFVDQAARPEPEASLLDRSVEAVRDMLLQAPDVRWDMARMAAYAGYSPWHFLRGFQRLTGLTPHAFQLLCRVRLLRSLLRAGTAGVEAAVSAGFTDQSHMHKVFKRYHAMTPRQFQQAGVMLEP